LDPIPNITIRFATTNDAPAIAALLFESFVEYESLYTPEGFAATAITSKQIIARMSEGPVGVAVCDEEIVGTVSAVAKAEALYIRGMAALPSARGKQIGGLLLTQVEEFARTEGFSHLLLSTTPFLDRPIRLYERYGFHRTSEGPHELFGTPLFTMEKSSNAE
jgi:GNAT superfamily N-acetyltransferase